MAGCFAVHRRLEFGDGKIHQNGRIVWIRLRQLPVDGDRFFDLAGNDQFPGALGLRGCVLRSGPQEGRCKQEEDRFHPIQRRTCGALAFTSRNFSSVALAFSSEPTCA